MKDFFKVKESGSSVKTEFIGGLTTFLTMSYIIVVQPVVLSKCGMDFGAVIIATCIGSAIGTLLMAFLANYPIALAPAMGHNFYLSYIVCIGMGIHWTIALGANFLSGILFIILSMWGVREHILKSIPVSLRNAISAGIGFLITLVGLEWAGIVVPAPGTYITLGSLGNPATIIAMIGFIVIIVCLSLNISGGILYGIISATVLGLIIGLTKFQGIFSLPQIDNPAFMKLDIIGVFKNIHTLITIIFVLWFLDVFDSIGTLLGIGEQAGFIKNNKLPRAKKSIVIGCYWHSKWHSFRNINCYKLYRICFRDQRRCKNRSCKYFYCTIFSFIFNIFPNNKNDSIFCNR